MINPSRSARRLQRAIIAIIIAGFMIALIAGHL
jgi:hypothetical protein